MAGAQRATFGRDERLVRLFALRSGVELKRRPIKRFPEHPV